MSVASQTQREQAGTVELDAVLWKRAVLIVSDKAHRKHAGKGLEARITAGTALALNRAKVVYDAARDTWKVAGSPKPGSAEAVWHNVNGLCDCPDYARAPQNLCKHRIAAGITQKARTMRPEDLTAAAEEDLPPPKAVASMEDDVLDPDTDAWEEAAGSEPALAVPASVPEALFSLTLHGQVDRQDAMLTVRGMTPEGFLANLQALTGEAFHANLQALRAQFDPTPVVSPSGRSQTAPAVPMPTERRADWCDVCDKPMKLRKAQDGGKDWYSHKLADGSWCKGQVEHARDRDAHPAG